ncbi:hypothetical protein [Chryseobacterium timonianum]|uniref:hypothetical protein n=2 Tax=Chryseobacterium TaxID=59732 RepID=UPI00083B802F|nr:hypothetical protein [Chryseobacterium timonianum]
MFKKATLSILAILFLVSCKKKTLEQKIENLPPVQTTGTTAPTQKPIADMDNNSFTLSCGSGCAATYTAEDISQNKTSVRVKFKVDNYLNDEQAETTYETYIFNYTNTGDVDKIINEETQKNILNDYILSAQESFKEFAASLVKDKKIEIPLTKGQNNPVNKK